MPELRRGPAHRAVERVHVRREHEAVSRGVLPAVLRRGLGDHRRRRRREGIGTLGRLELVGGSKGGARARHPSPRGSQALARAATTFLLAHGVLASLVQVEEFLDDVLVDVAEGANEVRLELLVLLDARVKPLLRGVDGGLELRHRRRARRLLLRDQRELRVELELDADVVVGAHLDFVGARDQPRLQSRQRRVGFVFASGKLGELLVPGLDDVSSLLAGLAELGVEQPALLGEVFLENLVFLVVFPRRLFLLVAVVVWVRLEHPVRLGEFLRLLASLVVLELPAHHVLERAFGRVVGAAARESSSLGGILRLLLDAVLRGEPPLRLDLRILHRDGRVFNLHELDGGPEHRRAVVGGVRPALELTPDVADADVEVAQPVHVPVLDAHHVIVVGVERPSNLASRHPQHHCLRDLPPGRVHLEHVVEEGLVRASLGLGRRRRGRGRRLLLFLVFSLFLLLFPVAAAPSGGGEVHAKVKQIHRRDLPLVREVLLLGHLHPPQERHALRQHRAPVFHHQGVVVNYGIVILEPHDGGPVRGHGIPALLLDLRAEVVGVQGIPCENLFGRGDARVPFGDELVTELFVDEQVLARDPLELVGVLVSLDGLLELQPQRLDLLERRSLRRGHLRDIVLVRGGDRDDLGLRILRLGFSIRGLLVLEDGFVRVVSGFIRKRPGSVRAPLRPRLLRGRD